MAGPAGAGEAFRVLPVLDVLVGATDEKDLVDRLLPRLHRMISADRIVWIMQDERAWTVRTCPDGRLPARLLREIARTDPLLSLAFGRTCAAIRRSDVQSTAGYRASSAYRLLPVDHQILLSIGAGAGRHACLLLGRAGPEFTASELLFLEILRPRLAAALGRLAPAHRPQWITERETAVLDLVVQGLTNRQIASRLGISPRTVGKHLEHSYAKLNEPCRVAAAMRWSAAQSGNGHSARRML